jgi:hypothetical protein
VSTLIFTEALSASSEQKFIFMNFIDFAPTPAVLAAATTTSARLPSSARFECPAQYGNFPHSTYCNLYWMCRGGEAYLTECDFSWLFDKKLGLCDLPQNVDCGNLIVPGTKRQLVS